MSDTKWEEIRLLMLSYSFLVSWRTLDLESKYISDWDNEWYYHFRSGGYKSIEWLQLKVVEKNNFEKVLFDLQRIHVPGKVEDNLIKIFGYQIDSALEYL